jgi:hypothetical protein
MYLSLKIYTPTDYNILCVNIFFSKFSKTLISNFFEVCKKKKNGLHVTRATFEVFVAKPSLSIPGENQHQIARRTVTYPTR